VHIILVYLSLNISLDNYSAW